MRRYIALSVLIAAFCIPKTIHGAGVAPSANWDVSGDTQFFNRIIDLKTVGIPTYLVRDYRLRVSEAKALHYTFSIGNTAAKAKVAAGFLAPPTGPKASYTVLIGDGYQESNEATVTIIVDLGGGSSYLIELSAEWKGGNWSTVKQSGKLRMENFTDLSFAN